MSEAIQTMWSIYFKSGREFSTAIYLKSGNVLDLLNRFKACNGAFDSNLCITRYCDGEAYTLSWANSCRFLRALETLSDLRDCKLDNRPLFSASEISAQASDVHSRLAVSDVS
jgi:hypothetical protein